MNTWHGGPVEGESLWIEASSGYRSVRFSTTPPEGHSSPCQYPTEYVRRGGLVTSITIGEVADRRKVKMYACRVDPGSVGRGRGNLKLWIDTIT